MSVSPLTGLNIGQEFLPGVAVSKRRTIKTLRSRRSKGFKKVRLPLSNADYTPAVNLIKELVLECVNLGFTEIIAGVGKNPFKSSEWAALVTKIKAFAVWCQANGVTIFQISNEIDAYFNLPNETATSATRVGNTITVVWPVPHGYSTGESMTLSGASSILNSATSGTITKIDDYTYSFTTAVGGSDGTANNPAVQPTPSTVVSRLKTLATELKAMGITMKLLYSVAQGFGSNWNGGLGDIDFIGLNVYGEGVASTNLEGLFDNFKAQIAPMKALHGSKLKVTEWSLHAAYGSYPKYPSDQEKYIRKRYEYLEEQGIEHYFFCDRSNSHSGNQNENFAAQITWDTGGEKDGVTRWLHILTGERNGEADLRPIASSRMLITNYGKSIYLPGDTGNNNQLQKINPVGMDFTKTGAMTWMGWIKPMVDEARPHTIVRKDNSSVSGYKLMFEKSGNNRVFNFQECKNFSTEQFIIPNDRFVRWWNHWAITVTGNSNTSVAIKFYWNGLLLSKNTSVNWTNAVADNTSPLRIGDEYSPNCPNALIDEMQYYATELSQKDIRRCMFNKMSLKGVKGYWKMDEGTGLSIADSSDNGNDLTINGDTTFSDDVVMDGTPRPTRA